MCIRARPGRAWPRRCVDALEKLAAARGAKSLTVDASDNAEPFFKKRGYVAKQRNSVTVNGEWLANTTMQKTLESGGTGMSRERLYLFDTTLRDGAQTNGVDFTLADKQVIAGMLDDLGIDYVEGGYPGANPTDTEFFRDKPKLNHARFTAFGMTRRAGRSVSNDPGVAGLLEAKADAICFVAKSSAYQVRVALETTQRGKSRLDPRQRRGREGGGPRGDARLRAFLRRLQGEPGLRAGLRQGGLRVRRALGGAVRHQWRHHAARGRDHRRARWRSTSPAAMSASMPITTPSRRSPIRSPPCAPARGRSRAR